MADILFELGCEELPPKTLYKLSKSLFESVCDQLKSNDFKFEDSSRWFASPRRLAFILNNINESQQDKTIEKRGPAIKVAFDKDGKASPAALGFARSVNADVSELKRIKTDQGEWIGFEVLEKGQSIANILPNVIQTAIKQLPIAKPMRWGNNDFAFIRPVHWLLLLKDKEVIPMSMFGKHSGNLSKGHRFHHPEYTQINSASSYVEDLQKVKIIVDQNIREQMIKASVQQAVKAVDGIALIDTDLLEEVACITEFPVAVLGQFDPAFLSVPTEALISSMQKHQKYFPVTDTKGQLKANFVALANIESKQISEVVKGFEKVITPRLADARFFWQKDKERPMADNISLLQKMVFESSLGSIADKTARITKLLNWLSDFMIFDKKQADTTARLMKCDLMADMVDEFPDLQGIMGGYYAVEQGEGTEVSKAIRDQYLPKFVGDKIPETTLGQALSMADKMDTLCGIFAVGKKPTGSKDPFGLRRATLSIISILQDQQININVSDFISEAIKNLPVDQASTHQEVLLYFQQRLKNQYRDKGVPYDAVNAVLGMLKTITLTDFEQRVKATVAFKKQNYASSLIEANKRTRNILSKSNQQWTDVVNPALFESKEESDLYKLMTKIKAEFTTLLENRQYSKGFKLFASMVKPIDAFFEKVMVNAKDDAIRKNRHCLLTELNELFSSIANISHLLNE